MKLFVRLTLVLVCLMMSSSYVYADLAISNYYNLKGQLEASHRADGNVVNYLYDNNGNLISKSMNINLLNNPSFETIKDNNTIADGWSTWSNTKSQDKYEVVTSPVSSGTKAQKISSFGMPMGSALWALQDVVVQGNKPFVVSGQFYVESQQNSQIQILIQFFDGSNNLLGTNMASMPPGMYYSYMTLAVTGTIPAATKRARIHAGIEATKAGGSGSFIVDSFSFQYDLDGNRLINGGMSSSTVQRIADGWSTWSNTGSQDSFAEVTSPVLSGKKARKISSSGMPAGSALWALQDVVVEENKAFVLNGQLYVESQQKSQVQLFIQFFDGANNYLGNITASMPPGMYYSNMTLAVTGSIPSGAKRARIHVGLAATGGGGAGSFIVDSLNFKYDSDRNRLVNGGLDSSTALNIAYGWSTWSNTRSQDSFEVVTSPVSSGTKAQKISSSGMPNGTEIWILQDFVVEDSKAFIASGQFYVEQQQKSQVQLFIQFFDASNNFLGSNMESTPGGVKNSYTSIPVTGIIPAGAKRARIHAGIKAVGTGGSGSVIVDSLSFRYE